MKKISKVIPGLLLFAILAAALGPFFVPVAAMEGLVSEMELAEQDSRFIEIHDVTVHYKESGAGDRTFILLHGFGASLGSWRQVMGDFSKQGRVIAYDRPAFGLTERPMPEDWTENPYGIKANIELLRSLMDALEVQKAVLVGNSAGGGLAVAFGLEYPERVEALILVDPGVGGGRDPKFPDWALPLMWTPQMRHLAPLMSRDYQETLPQTLERQWFDPSRFPEADRQAALAIFKIKNWDRALYELTFAPAYPEIRPQLPQLTPPVLVIAGAEDRLIRSWYFEAISQEIPNARLNLIPDCGHVPHQECPQEFMKAVNDYLEK